MWALIEQIRQLLFDQSVLGNPAPPAPIPTHALRLCQRLFYPSVSQDLPLILNQYDFNKYDFSSRLMTVDGVYTRCCIKSMKQHMVRQLIAPC